MRGCAYDKQEQIELSIEDFSRVLDLDPYHVNAAYARGAAENKRGNYMQAISDYNMALNMDSHRKNVNEGRKFRALNLTNAETATNATLVKMEQFKKIDRNKLLLSPSAGKQQTRVGFAGIPDLDDKQNRKSVDISIRSSHNDSIIQTQTTPTKLPSATELQIINVTPIMKQQAETYHSKGYQARKSGDYTLAIEYYSQALQVHPQHFKALFNRGFAYDKLQNFEQAIADYSTAIAVEPNNAFTYYNKGISLDRMGAFNQAIECFSTAINLEGGKADFYHNRGFAYRKNKDYEKAIDDYTKAINLDNSHFKAFYNRAFCFDKQNRLYQAEEDYVQACLLQANNISALHHLGTIREKIGGDRLPLALQDFNKVL